jgi:hypothetical protein
MKLRLLRGMLVKRDLANGTDLFGGHIDELMLAFEVSPTFCELLYFV